MSSKFRPQLEALNDRVTPATLTWKGAPNQTGFANAPANWNPAQAPAHGDTLVLPAGTGSISFPHGSSAAFRVEAAAGWNKTFFTPNGLTVDGGFSTSMAFVTGGPLTFQKEFTVYNRNDGTPQTPNLIPTLVQTYATPNGTEQVLVAGKLVVGADQTTGKGNTLTAHVPLTVLNQLNPNEPTELQLNDGGKLDAHASVANNGRIVLAGTNTEYSEILAHNVNHTLSNNGTSGVIDVTKGKNHVELYTQSTGRIQVAGGAYMEFSGAKVHGQFNRNFGLTVSGQGGVLTSASAHVKATYGLLFFQGGKLITSSGGPTGAQLTVTGDLWMYEGKLDMATPAALGLNTLVVIGGGVRLESGPTVKTTLNFGWDQASGACDRWTVGTQADPRSLTLVNGPTVTFTRAGVAPPQLPPANFLGVWGTVTGLFDPFSAITVTSANGLVKFWRAN